MTTINEITPKKEDIENTSYDYQSELTSKLDGLDTDFDQNTINEIVLWKVNRYVSLDTKTIELINGIKNDAQLNEELTRKILRRLLETKGVRLAMASTILRFRNPKIYQIIDQRVYRFIYGEELKYPLNDIDKQIEIYLDYLQKLKEVCEKYNIMFEKADRIFYSMDKIHNKSIPLNGYSNRSDNA